MLRLINILYTEFIIPPGILFLVSSQDIRDGCGEGFRGLKPPPTIMGSVISNLM